MPDKNNTEQRWIKVASSLLKGKTVDYVRYMTQAERTRDGNM